MVDEYTEPEPATEIDVVDADEAEAAPVSDPAPTTGHPAVDEVLNDLDRLEALGVHEHVAVFEAAHQDLRRALDDGGR